jgi:diguanylate cyclase (GGDEF)-like protein
MAQTACVALVPVLAIGAWLALRSALAPGMVAVLAAAAGGGVAVAALVAALHGRWVLQRFAALASGAADLSREKFPVALAVPGKDEYGTLATVFNDLARQLGLRHAVQRVLAQMDEALFNKPDIRILVRGALRCLAEVTRAEVSILALFEPDSDEALTLYVMNRADRGNVRTVRVELDAEHRRRLPAGLVLASIPGSPFPDDFAERLRKEHGIQHYLAMPVSRGNRVWGYLIACHGAPVQLAASRARLLGAACNRLIAGFRNAERDRTIHSLAFVDRLTGLPNRTALESVLAQRIATAQRDRSLVAVLLIDLDRFKQVNDTYGHALGDHLLVETRRRIQIHLIDDDIAARIGGDAFALVLSHVSSPRDAALVARKLIRSLSRAFHIGGNTLYTGASVGIALLRGDRDRDTDLLKMAEAAMYRAKAAGRNRLAFYEPQMNADSRRRSQLEAELRAALKHQEFRLHYQPQIDLKTGALAGVEALLRWQHPTLGLLSPGHFIADAETMGLIPEIGAWVLREACEQHRRWRAAGLDMPRVSVNVSNGQLPRSNFVSSVREITAAAALPAGVLEIEVTETMLVDGGTAAFEALDQLAADGVHIAIDDFGTGYSSFSYLKVMPAQVLKLDMSFIVDLHPDDNTGKIVAAIINMAHALQKEVVAEGIERSDQLQLLKTLGCDRGQGYLLGRPVPADDIVRGFTQNRDFSQPPAAAAWTLPPMPAPAAAPARTTVPQRAAARAAPAPAPVSADPWNDDMLEEPLTVPRFLDDDFSGPGGR